MANIRSAIAFRGQTCVADGPLPDVALRVMQLLESDPAQPILVFDRETAHPIDLDLRGAPSEVAGRYALPPVEQQPDRVAGRPRLGVVAREVTLLPRHWEWLATQPGGASAALRRLVEEARKANAPAEARRLAQESAYRLTTALAGNEAGYEEAVRALFAGSAEGFDRHTAGWPADVRQHALRLASEALR